MLDQILTAATPVLIMLVVLAIALMRNALKT